MASDRSGPAAAPVVAPARQRSHGRIRLEVGRMGAGTRIRDIAEAGPLRLRLPRRPEGPCEAVLLNTAGGIACGDLFSVEAVIGPGADLTLTTTAAEKIYRSDGPVTRMATRVTLGSEARLAFLPQETILFDHAALDRRFEADLAPDAHLLAFEAVTFGRTARHERLDGARFTDTWRIRRGGRLAYAESVRLTGSITDRLARSAIGGGARAMATLLDVSPEAEARIDAMRALLAPDEPGVEAAASAWNGLLVARFLARDPDALRRVVQRVLTGYRGLPLPRVWQS